jgi:hypothetical protein
MDKLGFSMRAGAPGWAFLLGCALLAACGDGGNPEPPGTTTTTDTTTSSTSATGGTGTGGSTSSGGGGSTGGTTSSGGGGTGGTVTTGGGGTGGAPNCDGPNGCYSCKPTVDVQFLNACTNAQCSPFDNVARLPLYNGGNLPPVP